MAGGRLKLPNPPACYRHVHLHSIIALLSLTLIRLIEVVSVAATIAATTFKLKKKTCNIKFFHSKAKAFVEEIESKLEQYCKRSEENIISKL